MHRFILVLVVAVVSNVVHSAGVPGQGTWESTLQARDIENDGVVDAYYDTVLDVTWLADANYAQTSSYDVDGLMTWDESQTWIGTLNAANYLGTSDWRLTEIVDLPQQVGCDFTAFVGSPGGDCGPNPDTSTSEMAYMFYETLGNLAFYDTSGNPAQPGWGLSNTGLFENIEANVYWSGSELGTDIAWNFNFNTGWQSNSLKSNSWMSWAVRDGDIAPVPVPSAFWLFSSALGLIGWMKRRAT